MFGAHMSVAGGLENALHAARERHMDCVQVFTTNQRQWAVSPLRDEQIEAWNAGLAANGWRRGSSRVVTHNSYLVNLASPDPALWRRSLTRQRTELERCEALGIRLCVAHPGAHLGEPRRATDERAGLKRIARALDRLHRDLPGYRVLTCLETTVGAGTTLGYCFEQLAWIRGAVADPDRVAFCFDTCHVTAAGYDMTTERKATSVLRRFSSICGRRTLRVFHVNDSQGAVGSRRDRHAHIGHGHCGLACFRAVVNCRAYDPVPKVLETPKGTDERGVEWDLRNLRRLRRLRRAD